MKKTDGYWMSYLKLNTLLILASTDFKLVIRTTRFYLVLLVTIPVIAILVWKYGVNYGYLYLVVQVLLLSMIFSTQFTRTKNEMASYIIFPFPIALLVVSKNINSMLCVAGSTLATLLITASIGNYEIISFCHAAIIVFFVSFVLLFVGNVVSIRSLNGNTLPGSFASYITHIAPALLSLFLYLFIERHMGSLRSSIFCLIMAASTYFIALPGIVKRLVNSCNTLLET